MPHANRLRMPHSVSVDWETHREKLALSRDLSGAGRRVGLVSDALEPYGVYQIGEV